MIYHSVHVSRRAICRLMVPVGLRVLLGAVRAVRRQNHRTADYFLNVIARNRLGCGQ
jgi:hypothetical protein